MELIDYWYLLRKWHVVILVGTVLSLLAGYAVAHKQQATVNPIYLGTAMVQVNYITPPGAPYVPTLSVHSEADILADRINDPGALSRVEHQVGVKAADIRTVSTSVDLDRPLITVQVLGIRSRTVGLVARGMAQYLVSTETQKVAAEARGIRAALATKVATAKQHWLAAQQRYYAVCGCIGTSKPKVGVAALAQLHANVDVLQTIYASLADAYRSVNTSAIPVATVAPGETHRMPSQSSVLFSLILPVTLLGFLLSVGLAALLDYAETVPVPIVSGITALTMRLHLVRTLEVLGRNDRPPNEADRVRDLEERLAASQHQIQLLATMRGVRDPEALRPSSSTPPPYEESAG